MGPFPVFPKQGNYFCQTQHSWLCSHCRGPSGPSSWAGSPLASHALVRVHGHCDAPCLICLGLLIPPAPQDVGSARFPHVSLPQRTCILPQTTLTVVFLEKSLTHSTWRLLQRPNRPNWCVTNGPSSGTAPRSLLWLLPDA